MPRKQYCAASPQQSWLCWCSPAALLIPVSSAGWRGMMVSPHLATSARSTARWTKRFRKSGDEDARGTGRSQRVRRLAARVMGASPARDRLILSITETAVADPDPAFYKPELPQSAADSVKPKRIADTDKIIRRIPIHADPGVKIDLLGVSEAI